jgi:nitroreductase
MRLRTISQPAPSNSNILLTAESLGLGTVWLGQIVKNKHEVNAELGISSRYDLMAVAVGYPAHRNQKSHRKSVNDFILKKWRVNYEYCLFR